MTRSRGLMLQNQAYRQPASSKNPWYRGGRSEPDLCFQSLLGQIESINLGRQGSWLFTPSVMRLRIWIIGKRAALHLFHMWLWLLSQRFGIDTIVGARFLFSVAFVPCSTASISLAISKNNKVYSVLTLIFYPPPSTYRSWCS